MLDAVRIDDLTAIMNDIEPGDTNIARPTIDLDLRDRADIGANQLVFHVAGAAPPCDITDDVLSRRRSRLPFREFGNAIDDFEAPLVGRVGIVDAVQRISIRRRWRGLYQLVVTDGSPIQI